MLSKLIDNISTKIALRRLNKLPAVHYGRQAINEYWVNKHEIIKDFSSEFVRKQAGMMMGEVIKIATSEDPRMTNRKKLTDSVIEYAQYQVLVIDPPPVEDPTGLRGQPGISGELKPLLFELAQKEKSLIEFLHGVGTPKKWDDVWNPVLGRYRIAYAWTHLFNNLRASFNDVNYAADKDWYKPFVSAMCTWWEYQYREALAMPPVLDNTNGMAGLRAVMFSTFANCVMSGGRYPDLEWKKGMDDFDKRE